MFLSLITCFYPWFVRTFTGVFWPWFILTFKDVLPQISTIIIIITGVLTLIWFCTNEYYWFLITGLVVYSLVVQLWDLLSVFLPTFTGVILIYISIFYAH